MTNSTTVAVVGLGYVGLPLAVEFGKVFPTIGFDLSQPKIDAYRGHVDPTGEVSAEDMKSAMHLTVTSDPTALADRDAIVTAAVGLGHQHLLEQKLRNAEAVSRPLFKTALELAGHLRLTDPGPDLGERRAAFLGRLRETAAVLEVIETITRRTLEG